MCQRFFQGKTDSAEEKSSVRNSSQTDNLHSELCKQKTLVNIQFTRVFGTPDWIRTSDLQSRSLTLYPTELRAHFEQGIL